MIDAAVFRAAEPRTFADHMKRRRRIIFFLAGNGLGDRASDLGKFSFIDFTIDAGIDKTNLNQNGAQRSGSAVEKIKITAIFGAAIDQAGHARDRRGNTGRKLVLADIETFGAAADVWVGNIGIEMNGDIEPIDGRKLVM